MLAALGTRSPAVGYRSSRSLTVNPFSLMMSITRDFIVVTVMAVPSTLSVTVL
jgi:hypothetical protein